MNDRLSQEQLAARLTQAKTKVQVGGRYEHYKKLAYVVLAVALWEETNEPCVVYQAQYGVQATFIRPLAAWDETVVVGDQTVPRFRRIDD